jgi:hypothetical protein
MINYAWVQVTGEGDNLQYPLREFLSTVYFLDVSEPWALPDQPFGKGASEY